MAKRPMKTAASAARAFGTASPAFGMPAASPFGTSSSSSLSYLTELMDLTTIGDSQLVVIFKNLSKRDPTTKAKALEDLQRILSAEDKDVDDATLDAWINIYPRTSIETSRRVRLLAHSLQGYIASRSGKRFAKRMPLVVGPWLAGGFDTDKGVARAASDALTAVFPTEEKRRAIWKAYQTQLLDFCRDVLDKQSPTTLSDERSVSPEELVAKYNRVVVTAIRILSNLIAALPKDEFTKNQSDYDELLQDKNLWSKATNEDPGVRRATHKLLCMSINTDHSRTSLDLDLLSTLYLSKGLDSDQSNSAADYLEAIMTLSAIDSSIWTRRWRDKKPPSTRLRNFVKRGSQGASMNYWSTMVTFFQQIPTEALPRELDKATDLMTAFQTGITRKEELRAYVGDGWKAYVEVACVLSKRLNSPEGERLLSECVLPILSHYLFPITEETKWAMPAHAISSVLTQMIAKPECLTMILSDLAETSRKVVRKFRLALPEQSQDHARSQEDLSKLGHRYTLFISSLLSSSTLHQNSQSVSQHIQAVLEESFAIIVSRNGKPYGVTAAISELMQSTEVLFDSNEELLSTIRLFVEQQMAEIYVSPSYRYFAVILETYARHSKASAATTWRRCLDATLESQSDLKYNALVEILSCREATPDIDAESMGTVLAPEILPRVDTIWTHGEEWSGILDLLSRSEIVAKLFSEAILDRITTSLLGSSDDALPALKGVQGFSSSCPTLLSQYMSTEHGKALLPNLLLLTESADDQVRKEAESLLPVAQTTAGVQIADGRSGNAVVDVIQDGLNTAGLTSVSVDTLVNHANRLLSSNLVTTPRDVLPNGVQWAMALRAFLCRPADQSLAITSPLAGAVYLVKGGSARDDSGTVSRDPDGLSIPLRMAIYVVKLWNSNPEMKPNLSQDLTNLLNLTLLLANDHLSISSTTNLWSRTSTDVVTEVSDMVADGSRLLGPSAVDRSQILTLLDKEQGDVNSNDALEYYIALSKAKTLAEEGERHSNSLIDTAVVERSLKASLSQQDTFSALAQLYGYQIVLARSSIIVRQCNELIADLSSIETAHLVGQGLRQLVVLNVILSNYDDIADTIAKPRLSRFISKAVSWLLDEEVTDEIIAEVYRALDHLLPLISDMYGDYWKNILNSIRDTFELIAELPDGNAPAIIPTLHAALRLYAGFRRIEATESSKADDERNDDIVEAWTESESGMTAALINALKVRRNIPDDQHQPLMIFNELLSREVARIPTGKIGDVEDLFPQLYSPSPAIQQGAYRLLHRYIPAQQEQVSVDTVLEKRSAKLPDELLSLVLETPVAGDLYDEDFERSVPLQLRGYLLSWLLIFDHFTNASSKVCGDYVEHMKEAGHLNDFLDFAFDFLGHGKAKPLDVSKFDISTYNTTTMQDNPLKDTQWLITHLYYLCLVHFSSLTTQWWNECKSRAKVNSVKTWTEKFISPRVSEAALQAVASWSTTQEQNHTSTEPAPLTVKVNHRTFELTASYPIDDEGQSVSMLVTLPASFPLESAIVSSPSKMRLVDERNWNAWLRASQGLIRFSNNGMIDGLLAWQRNIFGSLQGHTECSICYSIVGENGSVPTKKCSTCKNMFHSQCLFKWFKSSNGTTCPLCRQNYVYT